MALGVTVLVLAGTGVTYAATTGLGNNPFGDNRVGTQYANGQLRTSASCDKGGGLVADVGPGNDWRCVVTWRLPGSAATGSAIYQLDVSPDGHYVADGDGPQEVNGFFQVYTPTGDAPNPLWQFHGQVDLLTAISA